jgi:NADH-quinone oxidoreductase subunit A
MGFIGKILVSGSSRRMLSLNAQPIDTTAIWPLVVYFAAVIGVVLIMIGLSSILGQRHKERETVEPYESGILSQGSARLRLSAKFYLVAMFFVIFDLEALFIFAWAISLRELGWAGYIEIMIFIGILIVALVYLWRLGALDWGSIGRKNLRLNR